MAQADQMRHTFSSMPSGQWLRARRHNHLFCAATASSVTLPVTQHFVVLLTGAALGMQLVPAKPGRATRTGNVADIGGGNDGQIANKFVVDEFMLYNSAVLPADISSHP